MEPMAGIEPLSLNSWVSVMISSSLAGFEGRSILPKMWCACWELKRQPL